MNIKKTLFYIFLFFSANLFGQMPPINYEKIAGKKLAYYENGDGEETIVLLHGWPQTSYVWRNVIPELSKNYRVIALDLPGLGKSETIDDYSTQNISQLINQFLTKKNINNVHLVGHDLGTWVAMTFALRFENKLNSLTLIDAGIPGLMDPKVFQPENADKIWQFYFHSIVDLPEFLVSNNLNEYFDWYFDKKSYIKNSINKTDRKIYVNAYKQKENLTAGFDYYRAYSTSAEFNRTNSKILNIPILAIGGEYALGENVGNAIKNYSTNLTNISLKNSGHYVPEEQPKKLAELIINHLKNN